MERYVDMNEISDGKLYNRNDLVKADCHGCEGCSACCKDRGTSLVLDPLDVYRLTTGLDCTFEQLLSEYLELNVVDGMILPNMKMTGPEEGCNFLGEDGRCKVHALRPGICRLFPLGRYYEDGEFRYFLQIHECVKDQRSKIKVKKWIDTPDLKENEAFINTWHYFVKDIQSKNTPDADLEQLQKVNLLMLHLFFVTPYNGEQAFYPQFYARLEQAKQALKEMN